MGESLPYALHKQPGIPHSSVWSPCCQFCSWPIVCHWVDRWGEKMFYFLPIVFVLQTDCLNFELLLSLTFVHSRSVGFRCEYCMWMCDVISNKSKRNCKVSRISLSEEAKISKLNLHLSGTQWRLALLWLKQFLTKWHAKTEIFLGVFTKADVLIFLCLPCGATCQGTHSSMMSRPIMSFH